MKKTPLLPAGVQGLPPPPRVGSVLPAHYSHVTGKSQLDCERGDQMAIIVQREGEQAKIIS